MDIRSVTFASIIDNVEHSSLTELKPGDIYVEAGQVEYNVRHEDNSIHITAINKGDKEISLGQLKVNLLSLNIENSIDLLVNPKSGKQDIQTFKVAGKSKKKAFASKYFTILQDNNNNSYLIGFKTLQDSKNYIEITSKNKKVYVSSVFILDNHKLQTGESLELDSIYYDFDSYYYEALQKYIEFAIENNEVPEGKIIGEDVKRSGIKRKRSSFRKKIFRTLRINHPYILDSEFLSKLMLKRIFEDRYLEYNVKPKKLRETMNVITGGARKVDLKYKELSDFAGDINSRCSIIPYVEKHRVLSLLVEGKANTYVLIMNLNRKEINLYADISFYGEYGIVDDVVTEVFSGLEYLVSGGKIFIRKFSPGDCMIFVKSKALDNAAAATI